MALTQDFKEKVTTCAQRDPDFAKAIFDKAVTLLLNGEAVTAKFMLCEIEVEARTSKVA